jgi:hypothetical protein
MRIIDGWLRSQIAVGLIVFLTVPMANAEGILPQQSSGGQQTQNVSPSQTPSQDTGSQDGPSQSGASQSNSVQTPSGTQAPVGTAVAPYEKTTGVAASRPAGAVIAPAKQRRARSFAIRVAIVVGAAVAVGTVVALSRGSSSRPN